MKFLGKNQIVKAIESTLLLKWKKVYNLANIIKWIKLLIKKKSHAGRSRN